MKKKQATKKLVLRKKAVSQLKENSQKAIKGGACSGTAIPDSPLCGPTFWNTCDTVGTY
jgi:hypothetical protein